MKNGYLVLGNGALFKLPVVMHSNGWGMTISVN